VGTSTVPAVLRVKSLEILLSSRFRVSSRTSAKIGRTPRSAKALAVETKLNAGTITSSPSSSSSSKAASSSACVQEVVSNAFGTPNSLSRKAWHRSVKGPSPEIWPARMASAKYFNSSPLRLARLKGMSCWAFVMASAIYERNVSRPLSASRIRTPCDERRYGLREWVQPDGWHAPEAFACCHMTAQQKLGDL